MNDIAQRVKNIIAEKLEVDVETLKDSATFREDLGADSLDIVEMVMDLETEFKIEISDDSADQVQTVGQTIKFIEEAVKQ